MRHHVSRSPIGLHHLAATGILGFGLGGLLIGRLTLALNPHLLAGGPRDPLLLLAYFAGGYALVGCVLGLVAGVALELLRAGTGTRGPGPLFERVEVAGLLLGPLLYVALLPDSGLNHGLLGSILFGASKVRLVLTLGVMLAAVALSGLALHGPATGLAHAAGQPTRRLVGGLWIVAFAVVLVTALLGGGAARKRLERPVADPASLPSTPDSTVAPVVLLCIDGLDPDDMVLPMAARGELPTLARLMREGVWGPLRTFEPTLSAIIWTSLITGKLPDQHGIRHFIVFRLPGIRKSIYQFPRHTGLNFRLFPVLERFPGMPALQAPYTSNMRQCDALWNIVGRVYPVGAYRWLVSWPAETLNGFNVAGGVGWLQIMSSFEKKAGAAMTKGFHNPLGVYANIEPPPFVADITDSMLAPYVGTGHHADPSDWKVAAIAAALRDPTGWYLPRLMKKYNTRFTCAAFYQVDEFCHYFTPQMNKGGIYSDAITERYRFSDQKLGEFLATLGDSTNVIIVSDHGYDFKLNHHTYAPDGMFLALGPAFRQNTRIEGLNVYDIAPLCLRLLNLPLPADMPRHDNPEWRSTLTPAFLALHPESTIPTYETARREEFTPVESPIDDQIKEQLRSLGYIN